MPINFKAHQYLVEARRLPLIPSATKNKFTLLEESYPHFVATIHPMDYLKLTTKNDRDLDRIMKEASQPLETYQKRYKIPTLMINKDTGVVLEHDGRHRAAMVLKSEGDTSVLPLVLYLCVYEYLIEWKTRERTGVAKHTKVFDNFKEAQVFKNALKRQSNFLKFDSFMDPNDYRFVGVSNIDDEITILRNMLKTNTVNSEQVPFTVHDIPRTLHNQYGNAFHLPISKLKLGSMK